MPDFSELNEAFGQPEPEEPKPEVESGLMAGQRGRRTSRILFVLIFVGILCGATGAYLIWRATRAQYSVGIRFGVPGSLNSSVAGLPEDFPILPTARLESSQQSVDGDVVTVESHWVADSGRKQVKEFYLEYMYDMGINYTIESSGKDFITLDFQYDDGAATPGSKLMLLDLAANRTDIVLILHYRP